MARGMISFEFETLADLENQLKRALGLGRASAGGVLLPVSPFKYPEPAPDGPRGVLGKPGDGMTFAGATTLGPQQAPIEPTKAQVEEQREISKENAAAVRTAESINAEVRAANKEAAAAAMGAVTQVVEPVKEALKTMLEGGPSPVQPLQEDVTVPAHMEDVTLDNLTTVDYPVLLSFCDRHPEVGVVTEKCKPTFFRKLVECKVKTYLETK